VKLHDLKPDDGSKKKRKRVGRGQAAGQGGYAGRGIKGQKSRGSGKVSMYFEGGQLPLVRRMPFKRGFTNLFRIEYQEVNVVDLDLLDAGTVVTPKLLAERGFIRDAAKPVAILGDGDLTKKLTVKAHRFTRSAQAKITGAGGSTEVLEVKLRGVYATIRKMRKEDLAKLYSDEA
jgi:large subunit ribosomal protein L15